MKSPKTGFDDSLLELGVGSDALHPHPVVGKARSQGKPLPDVTLPSQPFARHGLATQKRWRHITESEFLAVALPTNDKARELGWIV
jgi:hypothetical protein